MAELKEFVVTLLGGSTSGKTAFFSGINQAFVDGMVHLGDDDKISFNIVKMHRGSAKFNAAANTVELENVEDMQTAAAAEEFARISAAAAPAFQNLSAPQGGSAPAFAAAFSRPEKPVQQESSGSERDYQLSDASGADEVMQSQLMHSEFAKTGISRERGFLPGTQSTRFMEFTFEVCVNLEPVCLLTVSDYAGELLDAASDAPEKMLRLLSDQIYNSDAAIVLANARELSKTIEDKAGANDSMFKDQATKEAVTANSINNLFRTLNSDDITVLLAITQTDSPQVDNRISRGDYARAAHDLQEHIFEATFTKAKLKKWSYGVVPVSAIGRKRDGTPNVDEYNELLSDADMHQENIDTALLFCLYTAIMVEEQNLSNDLAQFDGMFSFFKTLKREDRARKEGLMHQRKMFQIFRSAVTAKNGIFNAMPCHVCTKEIVGDVGNTRNVKGGN
jgi:hypothetical protein